MCSADLVGISRRKGFKTTVRDRDARPAPDRVQRCFTAERPDRLWRAHITYVPTLAGFPFLAVVMDVCSRRIVGWAMATHGSAARPPGGAPAQAATENPARRKRAMLLAFSSRKEAFDVINEDLA